MKYVLFVVALVAGMIAMAGSATATTIPNAYPGKDGLIAFGRGTQIYTIRPDGLGLKQLTSSGRNYTPVWNPAGTEIAYEHESRGRVWNIWVMRADGSHQRQWTTTGTTYGTPAWSPSGKTLLFTTGGQWGSLETTSGTKPQQPSHALYGYSEDGGRNHRKLRVLQGNNPSWTKGLIAFTGSNMFGTDSMCDYPAGSSAFQTSCIEVYNTKSKKFSYQVNGAPCDGGQSSDWVVDWARWAPDGSNLLFAYQLLDGCGHSPWYTSSLNNSNLPMQAGDHQADYSPNGDHIVLTNSPPGQPGRIIIESNTGSNRRVLTQGYQPNWQPVH